MSVLCPALCMCVCVCVCVYVLCMCLSLCAVTVMLYDGHWPGHTLDGACSREHESLSSEHPLTRPASKMAAGSAEGCARRPRS